MRPNSIPGENIYHFRTRSQEILKNWAPSLRKNLGILQWVMEGTNSLIYVPLNDGEQRPTLVQQSSESKYVMLSFLALRESTEALDMVYGLHEDELI